MSNFKLGLVLIIVSWALISFMLDRGYGNSYAGYVLNFACGYLAGRIMTVR